MDIRTEVLEALRSGPKHFDAICAAIPNRVPEAIEMCLGILRREGAIKCMDSYWALRNARLMIPALDKAKAHQAKKKQAPMPVPPAPTLPDRLCKAKQLVDKASRVFLTASNTPLSLIGKEDALRDSAVDMLWVRNVLIELEDEFR